MLKSRTLVALAALWLTAGVSHAQPAPNALVPGAIAPYAPKRSTTSSSTPVVSSAIATPNGALTPSPARAGPPPAAPPPNPPPPPPPGGGPRPAAPAAKVSYDYSLGPGDKLRVTVFDEDKLSGEFVVAGNGDLSLPLVGDVPAAGKTVRQVLADITTKLSVFLKEPRVAAEVETFRPYYILGEVTRPGEYPYIDGITVLNAVATAGGFTYRADHKYVFIKRSEGATEQRVRLSGGLTLAPGDTVRVRERYF